jgi:flagellar biosynthesis protein FlhB
MDRWYAATRPIKYKQSQVDRAQAQILSLFLYCVAICLPFYYFADVVTNKMSLTSEYDAENKCQPSMYRNALTLFDAIFYSFIPFMLTLLFSVMTLVALVQNFTQKKTGIR